MQAEADDRWAVAQRAVEAAGGVVTAATYRDGVDFRYDLACGGAGLHFALRFHGVLRLPPGDSPVVVLAFDRSSSARVALRAAAWISATLCLAGMLTLLEIPLPLALVVAALLLGSVAVLGLRRASRDIRRRILSAVAGQC